jgi:hypothetical protein
VERGPVWSHAGMICTRETHKLVFFDGASITPVPPVHLATKPQRALDVREAEKLTKLNSPDG